MTMPSRLVISAAMSLLFAPTAFGNCNIGTFTGPQDNVMRAYIAYYGRPADSGGLAYWANRLAAEGGRLDSIIADFGTSKEFTDRYGGLNNTQLVKGVYRQLFGRDPESIGLNYYVNELNAGHRTLQTIALDVLFGAQNDDALIVANRLDVAKHFTMGSTAPGIDAANFDGDAMAAVLASVPVSTDGADAACSYFNAMLSALTTDYLQTFAVSKTADTDDGACDSDCSLREAIAAANLVPGRAGITLPAGVYKLTLGQLRVVGNVHVHGASTGQTIIDGNAASRHFALENPGTELVLSRMTLRNGNDDFGGAISNAGFLILDRVTITGNQARNGGGIINSSGVVAFDLTLSDNKAVSINASTGYGGGMLNQDGGYALFASRVSGNTATFNGGGVYSTSYGTIVNSAFSGNHAGGAGGGMDTLGSTLLIGSRFSANTGDDGGAISNREAGARMTVTTSSFEDNVAAGVDLGGGGAVFNYQGELSFTDSTFSRNQAFGEGGGAIETNGKLNLVNIALDANHADMHNGPLPAGTAPGFGGALLIIAGSTVQINNAQFTHGIAGNSGGGIYNDQNTQVTITNSLFQGNQAKGLFAGGGGYGGAIISEGNLSLDNSTLASNTSKEGGGGLSTNVGVVVITGSTVTGNTSNNGGGIAAYSGTLTVSDTAVSGNTATQFGGGLLNDRAQTTLTRVTLTGNHAAIGGGFSNNNATGKVSLDASGISANVAGDGSALVNFGTVNLKNSTISGTCNNHGTMNNLGGNTVGC